MQLCNVFIAALLTAVVSGRTLTPSQQRRAELPEKRSVCPDPFSPCQYEEDGECQMGYAACLQKMGCTNEPGGLDCVGTSLGVFSLFCSTLLFCPSTDMGCIDRLPLGLQLLMR